MANKFSIKKLAAGVLALLMVVTALPVSGIAANTAKAAENDTVLVYRSYNPNSGEHFMTIDSAEHKSVVEAGRDDEGVAWSAPVTSKTPVYRAYNPNSGEHLLVPQEEAEWLATQGWNNEGIKLYSDDNEGVAIYRVYNPNAKDAGSHLYTSNKAEAEWLVGQGWSYDNDGEPVLYGAVVDASNVVALTDASGFQADGTALYGDTLLVVFGSTFGTPSSVAWYRDGAVAKVITSRITAEALTYYTDGTTDGTTASQTDVGGTGEYYVVVENTAGQSYKSNTVTVVDEGEAVLYDFSINDNYEALEKYAPIYDEAVKGMDPTSKSTEIGRILAAGAAIIPNTTTTGNAVINITINKEYEDGVLYLVDASKDTIQGVTNTIDLDKAMNGTDSAAGNGIMKDVEKASKFTDTVLYETCFDTDKTGSTTGNAKKSTVHTSSNMKGIYYKDSDGAVHIKLISAIVNGQSVTRGTDYAIIYSDGKTTPKVNDKIEDYNVTDTYTAPYVIAPTSIEVTNRQLDTTTVGWSAQLYTGTIKSSWITYLTNNTDTYIKLYENTVVKNSDGNEFTTGANGVKVIGGKATDTATPPTYAGSDSDGIAVYAKFTGLKGVYGKEEISLTSEVAETAVPAVTTVTLSESETTASTAVITFDGLRSKASGTAYIYQCTDASAQNDGDKIVTSGDEIASVEVAGGTEKIEVEDIFSASDMADTDKKFYAVKFVPDNTDLYAEKNSAMFTLSAKTKSYKLKSGVTEVTAAATAGTKIDDLIAGIDQFGNTIEAIEASPYTNITADGTAAVMIGTSTVNAGTGTLEMKKTNDEAGVYGDLTFIGVAGSFKKGTYRVVNLVSGQKLIVTVKEDLANGADPKLSLAIE